MSSFSKASLFALTLSALSADPGISETLTPEVQSANEAKLKIAIATASQAWKNAFNAGDAVGAVGAAALYEENAVMVVKPFSTFTGRDEILAFWTKLVNKCFDNVVYTGATTVVLGEGIARVSASCSMNNASGIITNELWVLQKDGTALLRKDNFEVVQ